MGTFWHGSTKDRVKNGSVLGFLFGLLIASSSIPWIQSIVTTIVNLIPATYHFPYISYVTFGILGLCTGFIIDKW